MDSRIVVALSVLVAVVLVASVAYPASLTTPYSGYSPSYAVAHESTAAFDETVDQHDIDTAEPTDVTDLTPETQRAFGDAIGEPLEQSDYVDDGWQRLGAVTVCDDALLVCDEYETAPEFPEDGHNTYETYGVVEADGEVYLTETASGPALDFGPLLEIGFKVLLFVPYAIFLCLAAHSKSNIQPRETLAFAGYGVVLAAGALAFPYVLMVSDGAPPLPLVLLAIGVTWVVLFYGVYRHGQRRPPAETG